MSYLLRITADELLTFHNSCPAQFEKMLNCMNEIKNNGGSPIFKALKDHEPHARSFKEYDEDLYLGGDEDMMKFLCMKIDKLEDAIAELKK